MEWFLKGTEPLGPVQALAGVHPRILAPAPRTVIALEPDIPPSRQRIVFEARASGARLRWVLDGREIGPAADPLPWDPLPGRHTLSLVDKAQRCLDTVTFEVRGSAVASRD